MRPAIAVLMLAGLPALVSGCVTRQVQIGYAPPTAVAAVTGPRIAVGAFSDHRNEPPTYIGSIRGGYGNPLKKLESDHPVAEVVSEAFKEGLRARGLFAGDEGASYVLSGVINRLDADQYVRKEANAAVDVTVTEHATGRSVFSNSYKSEKVEGSVFSLATGVFASVDDLRVLASKALQEVVDGALDDPALRAAIR